MFIIFCGHENTKVKIPAMHECKDDAVDVADYADDDIGRHDILQQ